MGSNQDQLVRVANVFKDELTPALGSAVRYVVNVKKGQAAGLKIGFSK